jgi:hypothetical protein
MFQLNLKVKVQVGALFKASGLRPQDQASDLRGGKSNQSPVIDYNFSIFIHL